MKVNKKLKYFGITAVLVCACAIMYSKVFVKNNSGKDYSFKIKNVDIGIKDVYVEFQVGDDVDEKDSVIDDVVLANGDEQIVLKPDSVEATNKKNTYVEVCYLPKCVYGESEEEAVSKIKKLAGKKIDVCGKLHIKDENNKNITDKKTCKVNLMKEKVVDVNEEFTVDDTTVILKKIVIDKHHIYAMVEGNNESDNPFVYFDMKDDNNDNIQCLGGQDDRLCFEPKDGTKMITVAAYTEDNPLNNNSKRVNITLN